MRLKWLRKPQRGLDLGLDLPLRVRHMHKQLLNLRLKATQNALPSMVKIYLIC
jgi:hypothetical protein